jgi:hypothetical protein
MNKRSCISALIIGLIGFSTGGAACLAAKGNTDSWLFNPSAVGHGLPLLNLRYLNEKTAGEHGFIRVSRNGYGFVRGDGKPIRFWGVTSFAGDLKGFQAAKSAARFLARYGVNMVRFHGTLAPVQPGSRITDVNTTVLHQVWKLVAAMKRQGIYTTICPYWAVAVSRDHIQKSWHVPGNPTSAMSLLFWDPTMQRGYKAWIRALLTRPNPYTGIPLGRDPSVAIISLQNEDSMLFWNMQNIISIPSKENAQRLEIESLYARWLIKKYGSLNNALQAWHGVHAPGDDFAHGIAGMFINWYWTQHETGGMAVRLADQLHFFARTMYRFNQKMAAYIHNTLGARQLINPGNWKTVDPLLLNDVERWTYTAGNVTAIDRYTSGIHIGKNAAWAVMPGDLYTNFSCLTHPRSIPVNLKQVMGYPMVVMEGQWVAPDKYQAEGPFLVAAYTSLTGVAEFNWFSIHNQWHQPFAPTNNRWWHPMFEWSVATPEQIGQFPAAALMFRRHYIQRGAPAVIERRSLKDMWQRRTPIIAEGSAYNPDRDMNNIAPDSNIKKAVNPLAFLVGPVRVSYGGNPARSFVTDLSRYIHMKRGTVVSDTGQIYLNDRIGFCTLNAPNAQGAVGFFSRAGNRSFRLADTTIRCSNQYASILIVSMDGLPLNISRRVLIQVGTVARPVGWRSQPSRFSDKGKIVEGRKIITTGHNPWQVTDIHATVTIDNPGLRRATLLNPAGYAVKSIPVQQHPGTIVIHLPPDALYIVLQ